MVVKVRNTPMHIHFFCFIEQMEINRRLVTTLYARGLGNQKGTLDIAFPGVLREKVNALGRRREGFFLKQNLRPSSG